MKKSMNLWTTSAKEQPARMNCWSRTNTVKIQSYQNCRDNSNLSDDSFLTSCDPNLNLKKSLSSPCISIKSNK